MPVIAGRDAEIAEIGRFLQRARDQASALHIVGEPGIGKTAIFLEAQRLAADAGFAVLSCRPGLAESAFALAAVADIVRDIPPVYWAALPVPQRRAVEVALYLAEPGDDQVEQSAIAAGVRSLVAGMAADRPLLLGLDDVQWLDSGSAAVVSYVLRRIGGLPVAVLMTSREGEESAIDLSELLPAVPVGRMVLKALSLGAVSRLLAERFDRPPPRSTSVRIHEATRGNPLYSIELAHLLVDQGPTSAADPLPVPSTIRAVVNARVGALPRPTRDLLLSAAMLSVPQMPTLERIFGPRTKDRLRIAEHSGIASLDRGIVKFSHPLHAAAVIDEAGTDERRRMHRRLAAQIDDPEERSSHLALGTVEPNGDIARLVEAGAETAAQHGRLHVAADLLERSRALTPPHDVTTAHRRGLRAANLHAHAGDRARSRDLVLGLLSEPLDPQLRGEALRLSAELSLAEEDLAGAETSLDEALSFTERARDRAALRLVRCYVQNLRLDFSGAALSAQQAVDELRVGVDDALMADALARSAMSEFMIGSGVAWAKLERALVLHDPEQLALPGMGADGVVGAVMMFAERYAESRPIMAAVRQRLAERGDEAELATVMLWTSWLELRVGNFGTAERHAEEEIWYAELTSNDSMGRLALAQRAWIDAHTGDLDGARRRAAQATPPPGVGVRYVGVFLAATYALVANTNGDYREAWEACRHGIEMVERLGIREPVPFLFLPDGIEALIGLGDFDRAGTLIDALERRGRELDRVWAITTAMRCRGLLLAARGEIDAAAMVLEAALAEHDRVEMPFERARTLFVAGTVHRRARQRAQARKAFTDAGAEFDRLGARLWAERSRHELGRVEGRPVRSPEGLTPAEQQTAELARDGHSNKEIAQLTSVSVHTVEVHLSHAYEKLGVHSRAQLPPTIGTAPGDPRMERRSTH
jgi:DNA-binding CsgD family transcriptional regulator